MRSLALLALATLVLSGCAGSDEETTTSGSSTTGGQTNTGGATTAIGTTTGGTGTSGPTGGTGSNNLPIPQLGASATAGAAPFEVNFTVDATDADGDALSWTLAFGDGSQDASGTTVPASASHSYVAVGNYSVLLTVSDGTDTNSVTIGLNVTGGATQDEAADYTGNPAECFLTVLGDLEGVSHIRIEIAPGTHNLTFTAEWTTTSPPAWVEIAFWNDDGILERFGGWGNSDPPSPTPTPGQTTQTGLVTPTATYATLRACDGGPGSITYHAG